MKILFISEKWCDCNPSNGLTNSQHNLFGSLETSKLAEYKCFHYDEEIYKGNKNPDNILIQLCKDYKPNFIFYSHVFSKYNPSIETLNVIKNELGIPIVAIWWDSIIPIVKSKIIELSSLIDLNIAVDSIVTVNELKYLPSKFESLFVPQDTKIYNNNDIKRDIDISFLGSFTNYPDRKEMLQILLKNGFNVFYGGGQREEKLSVEEYANIFKRSKISLNFSTIANNNNIRQVKGRVFEVTLCGSLLFDYDNSETDRFFENGKDYIKFNNVDDLINKLNYFLCNENERILIANSGHKKAIENYNSEKFWSNVISLMNTYIN